MTNHRRWRVACACVVLCGAVLVLCCAPGGPVVQAREKPAAEQAPVKLQFQVDPAWPKRPDGAKWGDMCGIAVDAKDQIWIFTRAKPPVQVYRPDGTFVRSWGHRNIVRAHYMKFGPKGNVWLADAGSHVVMQFTPEGKLLKTLGTPGKAGCDETHMNQPTDMAVTPAGDVFVSDGYGNSRVVHFNAQGKFVKAWGTKGTGPGQFDLVHGIAVDSKGVLYVADRNNARVQLFDQSGKFLGQWADVLIPWGLFMTAKDEIWVCGSSVMPWPKPKGNFRGLPPKDQVCMKFDRSGKCLAVWTIPKGRDRNEKPGEVNWLHVAAPDSKGNMYLGDIRGRRAQKFVPKK